MKRFLILQILLRSARHLLVLMFVFQHSATNAQTADTTEKVLHFSGSISANNNGFSLVPTFSLGKPAVQTGFNISGNGRLSFHPQFWYSMLDYKPWSFIFIWHYQLVRKEKFVFELGAHAPAINFRSATVIDNGTEKDIINARRFYPALELIHTYKFNKNFSLGLYFLFGKGIDKEVSAGNYFLSFRPNFNYIPLSKDFFLRFNPQVYYLRINDNGGFYTAAGLTLAHQKNPFSIGVMMNREIKSDLNAKEFDWNISLNYAFAQEFVRKKQ